MGENSFTSVLRLYLCLAMKSHDRSPDQTVLGISMSKTLKARIAKAAEADDRSMANWCVAHLKRIVEQHEAKHGITRTEPLKVAESMGNESSHSTAASGAKAVKYPPKRIRKA